MDHPTLTIVLFAVAFGVVWTSYLVARHRLVAEVPWRKPKPKPIDDAAMPKLPTPNPLIRLVEPQDLLAIRAAVEERDSDCLVCLAEVQPMEQRPPPERVLLDVSVLALGEALSHWTRIDPPTKTWQRIDREVAERHLRFVLSQDLAYGGEVMDAATAASITGAFLGLFTENAAYFSNKDIGEDGSPGSGSRLLNSTMEGGIGVVDERRAGLLFVTGED